MLEEYKSKNWILVGPTKDRSSSPGQIFIESFLGRRYQAWGPTRRCANKEDSKVVNRDCVNHQPYSMSHNNQVVHVSDFFITNEHFPELIRKIISTKTLF